jgi:hypothetical protein
MAWHPKPTLVLVTGAGSLVIQPASQHGRLIHPHLTSGELARRRARRW